MSFYKEVPGRQTTLESTLKPDETHPNDVGHAVWAEYIYKRMKELNWV